MNRILFPHGLGDCIQALPSLRRYAEKVGPLTIGVLARLPACAEVLNAQEWCAGTFGVSDPWRDGPGRFVEHMHSLQAWNNARPIWTARPDRPNAPTWCKAARVAAELGVEWVAENPWPWAAPVAVQTNRAVLHGDAGNPPKNVSLQVLHGIARGTDHRVNVYEDVNPSATVAANRSRISTAGLFVGIDSGPAHLASCCDTPVVWVFRCTPIQQAIPLWRPVRVVVVGPDAESIIDSWDSWRAANPSMVKHEVHVTKGAANV